MFSTIKATAEQLGINDVELFGVYEILSNNAQASQKAVGQNRDNLRVLKHLSNQVRERNRTQLAKLLGQNRADQFITSFKQNQRQEMSQLINNPNVILRSNAY